ncbi:MAG: methyltransferase [Candidatus Hydrogenedentota bacterium]
MNTDYAATIPLPGEHLSTEKMPGHWLLARLGKRVLRPGGIELTRRMLSALEIGPADDVVEFAPGLGVTAQMTLQRKPATYTGIERDENAVERIRRFLAGPSQRCEMARAEASGLEAGTASVVYGEAMLSMQTAAGKARIVKEAHRVLRHGGRYGIHELCLRPDSLDEGIKSAIERDLSEAIRVGARPLTSTEWQSLLEDEGFRVISEKAAPMHLLELPRIIADEGIFGAGFIAWNVLRDRAARKRVLGMRRAFKKYERYLSAIMLIGEKTDNR